MPTNESLQRYTKKVIGLGVVWLSGLGNPTPSSFAIQLATSMENFPKTILWAWERPEHLKFIDPNSTGIAFLARTLNLRGDEVVIRPRRQPLDVSTNTNLIAVVRIETDPKTRPTLSSPQLKASANAVTDLVGLMKLRAVQIDFDAVSSEREFYRELLSELRRALPMRLPLSITALASWCMHDPWLDKLPIDEAVPMLFRMGAGQRQVAAYLKRHAAFNSPICRHSLGISIDEPLARLPARQRTYVFNPQPWTKQSVDQGMKEAAR